MVTVEVGWSISREARGGQRSRRLPIGLSRLLTAIAAVKLLAVRLRSALTRPSLPMATTNAVGCQVADCVVLTTPFRGRRKVMKHRPITSGRARCSRAIAVVARTVKRRQVARSTIGVFCQNTITTGRERVKQRQDVNCSV